MGIEVTGWLDMGFTYNADHPPSNLTRQINDRWEYVLQHDLGWQHDGLTQTVSSEWYGINQYLFRTVTDCLKLGIRFEWFRDDDGTRVAGLGDANPIFGAGFWGHFSEATIGVNCARCKAQRRAREARGRSLTIVARGR